MAPRGNSTQCIDPFAPSSPKAPDIAVIESTMSSATVVLAAEAYGVEPARIAKTLSLRVGDRVVLIVAAGTCGWTTRR